MMVDSSKIIRAADHAAAARTEAQAAGLVEISRALDAFAKTLTGPVPMSEQLSWPTKEAAARAYIGGVADTAQIDLLSGEATVMGETLPVLVASIIERADAYRPATAVIAGLRRKHGAAVRAATDAAAVNTVLAALAAELAALAAAAS